MITEPLFLVGAKRSGTTVLRLMLDHHSQITWPFEFEFVSNLLPDDDHWPELQGVYDYLITNRQFLQANLTIDETLSVAELVDSFLVQKRALASKPFVGATVHRDYHRLLRVWPNAKFIHLLRDARDVARSSIGIGWAGNHWSGAHRWIEAEQEWRSLRKNLAADRWIELKYEDLIVRPVEVLTGVCEFIGVPYEESLFDYTKDSTYERPDPSLIEQWRRKMTEEQIRTVEACAGDMMVECGYELSGLAALEITAELEKTLQRQSRLGLAKFRINRYGLLLYLEDLISRRLNIKAWRRRVIPKLNAIDSSKVR